jgi:hypothetical protein
MGSYPIYLRDHLKAGGRPPMRQVERYVADRRVVHW